MDQCLANAVKGIARPMLGSASPLVTRTHTLLKPS